MFTAGPTEPCTRHSAYSALGKCSLIAKPHLEILISSESKMQLKLSNCESSNLSLGTFSRDLFAQLFLVLGSHMGAPVVARCQPHRQALRFSVVQPFYCSTHQVRGCSIILCLGLPDSATSIQIWSNKIPTCSLAAHVCRPCSSLASRGYDFSEWEHGDLGNQRICATISWITTEAQQRTQQGWPIAIASRSGLWHWTYLDMIWTSCVGTSWTCLWYLLVSPSRYLYVAVSMCFDAMFVRHDMSAVKTFWGAYFREVHSRLLLDCSASLLPGGNIWREDAKWPVREVQWSWIRSSLLWRKWILHAYLEML